MQYKKTIVTPQKAQEWLKHNDANRPLNQERINEYLKMMKDGDWKESHQGIAIGKGGKVIDGQHRLHALIRYGKPLAFWVESRAVTSTKSSNASAWRTGSTTKSVPIRWE